MDNEKISRSKRSAGLTCCAIFYGADSFVYKLTLPRKRFTSFNERCSAYLISKTLP